MRLSSLLLTASFAALMGCQLYDPTLNPDYTIRVMPSEKGMVAVAPDCPSWATDLANPYDNQPIPHFGCAQARNLAFMVEKPEDLVDPRELGPTRGVGMVGAIRRYDNNQTRGLIYLSPAVDTSVDITTAPTAASSMTGDVTAGGNPNLASPTSGGGTP